MSYTTARRARQRLTAINAIINNLTNDVPRAINAIRQNLTNLDGYPTGGRGNLITTRGSSSVEQTAIRAATLHTELDDITAHLDAIADVCQDMLEIIRPRAPRLTISDKQAMRCSGGAGLPGALQWGRPDCTNIAEADRNTGLCATCRGRRQRWQQIRQQWA